MKKKIITLVLVVFLLIGVSEQSIAEQWLNVDISNSKRWVDTSHWEPYQAWVDTSHWEWRPYNVWVNSGYWSDQSYWTGEYWISNYQGWEIIAWGGDTPPVSMWGYGYFKIPSYFVNRLKSSVDTRAIIYRMDMSVNTSVHGPNEGYRLDKNLDVTYDYSNDYYPRILRRPWILWLDTKVGSWWDYDTYLYAKSYGYYRKDLIRNIVWINTSHWETHWGWTWVSSGYYETRYRWVTSGYWDEAHGEVSVSKSPTYIFTSSHRMDDGQPAYMNLNISWKFNKKVTKVQAYHDIVRFGNKGTIREVGIAQSSNGLNSTEGTGKFYFTYSKPGTSESKLYLQFTFDNNSFLTIWAPTPVNGFSSTLRDKTPNPVWEKSLLDAESVRF